LHSPRRILTSKADPIFRGSKPSNPPAPPTYLAFQSRPDLQGVKTPAKSRVWPFACSFQSRPDLQGVKTLGSVRGVTARPGLPKQTRSSGGQNRRRANACAEGVTFQSRPDLQGVKT